MMVASGDFVRWTTEKGGYLGRVISVTDSGRHAVVTSSGGTETIEASGSTRVARVRVYVDNEDGTYTSSDRTVMVRTGMLRSAKKPETKALSAKVKKTLAKKAADHNKKVGNVASKRTSARTLGAVFRRGVGAYTSNPGSVRPTVTSADQWAYARVNSFLYVLRNGKFRGGKHDTDLLPKGHPQSSKGKSVEKGPACRQAGESKRECVSRKTDEMIDEGMSPDQAYAAANNMCDTPCSEKGMPCDDCIETKAPKTHFPKRGEDKQVSLRNSNYPLFPIGYAKKLKADDPDIWRKGGNILGNTQFTRLSKVVGQSGAVKTSTDEKAVRLREAWAARHLKDHRLAGVVAQVKWLVVGSRGLSHMKQTINEARKKKGMDPIDWDDEV